MNKHHVLYADIKQIVARLQACYDDALLCEQYAWWLLEHLTARSRSQLLTSTSYALSDAQRKTVNAWLIALTEKHMPIQYILGSVPFLDLTIVVQPPVLIPRPETELWCAWLIEQLTPCAQQPLKILDLCSGSGCIALALAHALPNAHVTAIDNAPHALTLGAHNAQLNNIHNVTFLASDLFERLGDQRFDLIVSNPPYISTDEFKQLDASVALWEDTHALVADDDGYALIKKIIAQAPRFIQANTCLEQHTIPQLVIEHGHTQAAFLVDLMRKAGYTQVQTHKDLAGKDRVVCGRTSHVAATINVARTRND